MKTELPRRRGEQSGRDAFAARTHGHPGGLDSDRRPGVAGSNSFASLPVPIFRDGQIIVRMESGAEIRFPVAENPRLARGTRAQLGRIEISPFGLHSPDLDEDLSFRGLLAGDYGQHQKVEPSSRANSHQSPRVRRRQES